MSGRAELVVPAPPEATWRVVSDVERIAEWSPECYRIEWLDPAVAPGVGARFRGFNRMWGVRWSTVCTIDEWVPLHRYSYLARHSSGATTRWSYELEVQDATTLVTESFASVDSPGWVLLGDRLFGRPGRLRTGMSATLEGMRAAVTSGRAGA